MKLTSKEKAQELVDKYWGKGITNDKEIAKQCALIAVNEALNVFIHMHNTFEDAGLLKSTVEEAATYKFWQEVKQEIEKL